MLQTAAWNRIVGKRCSFIKMKHIWTVDRIVNSPFNDIVVPNGTITEYMWQNLNKWSDKTALICNVTDRQYTFLELYRYSQKFGASLKKKIKIKDGDVVVIMSSNSPEYQIVTLGVLAAGGIVATINPLYTAYEAQSQITNSEPKVIVGDVGTIPVIKEALKLSKLDIPIIAIDVEKDKPDESISYKELLNDNHVDLDILKEVKTGLNDTAFLLHSSGTTGLSKAVQLTHGNITANFLQHMDTKCKKFQDTTATNQDTSFAYLPMFHVFGLLIMSLQKLSAGLKVVSVPKFHPTTFLSAFEKHKITLLCMAPPTVLFLASSPLVKPKHLESVKYILSSAAPTPLPDVERLLDKINHDVHFSQGYGLTETASMITMHPNTSEDLVSIGFPLANTEFRVVDAEMNNLGPNELGELLIRGPTVMPGYKNNPEANAQNFVDGWLRSGDLAKIDEKGCVTIADRLKELIKVKAFQVAPAELEGVIKEHPAVFDAAVIGVPDDNTGEKPKAFVILNKDVRVSEENIMDFVSKKVSPYKRLKEVQFVNDIPKNPSGKILRRFLAQQYTK